MNKANIFNILIQEAGSTKQRLFLSAVYLFSTKGYSSVGIRELTRSVNIKESAFYNHFRSKESLFDEIINRFIEISSRPVFTNEEIEEIMRTGNMEYFLKKGLQIYKSINDDPLYYTLLQIILMESYTNIKAWQLVNNPEYYLQLEKVLEQMIAGGHIGNINTKAFTASYYYGLKGIMLEFVLKKVWNEDAGEMLQMMEAHTDLFINLLKGER